METTDSQLLNEWDYEQNKLKPTEISRTSAKRAWWKCSLGHSWKAKISDRTILKGKCTVCESQYRSVFPGLAVAYYANQKGLKVQLGSDKLLGIPLETYIPSEKLAIEFTSGSEQMEVLKRHLCKQRNIKLVKLPFKTKILLDYSLEKAKELGCGALCFEGNIDFYGKSGFRQASEFGIRYHGLPEGEDASFFLCKELIPGYLNGITGEYAPPAGYLVNEKEAEAFDREFLYMEKKKLLGQIFE